MSEKKLHHGDGGNNNNNNSSSTQTNNNNNEINNNNNNNNNKITKKDTFENDFVIISEFSEEVGPVERFIIPEGSQGHFNVTGFVLKIMAVDFQNKSNDPQAYLKDSQSVMPEPNEDAYTYLHHFNLLDVYARGYVRPMCISYITHDREKIMDNFNEIMTKVNKITKIMKKGNHKLFLRDLEDRMADVRHTQAVMNNGSNSNNSNNNEDFESISPTPTTVNEYLADLEVMHQKFHRAVTLKQQKRANSRLARSKLHHSNSASSHTSPNPQSHHSTHDDVYDDEDEMEEEEDEEAARERTVKSINKAVAELVARDYQPQVIHSLHPRTLHGKSLRNLHDLCDGYGPKALALVKSLHRFYSRPSTVLSLEAFDAPSLFPSSSLLTIGQAVVLNFNIGVDKYMNKVISYEAERVASASNIPSILSNNSTHNTASKDTSSSIDEDSSSYGSPYSMGSIASSPAHDDEAFANEVAKIANGLSAAGAPDLDAHFLVNSVGDEPVVADVANDEKSMGTPKLARPSPNANYFSAYLWPTHSQNIPGKGLLELQKKISWLRHIIYSLLRGRPVVVLGSVQNEGTVRSIVQALSIFVAGNNAGIAPWRTKPLKMSDLASFKLTGLVRSCAIPKAVEKYVTIFDLETDVLKAPPYPASGKFIDEIFAARRYWPDELSYLAHVHYVLFDIGVKACLYYHTCCVTVHQFTPQQASQAHSYIHPHHSHSSHPHFYSHHTQPHYSQPHHSHSHYPRSHSPRYPYPPSPHPNSQPPSPHPHPHPHPQPSPNLLPTSTSQPPSPRHPNQPPSPRRPANSVNTSSIPSPSSSHSQPQNSQQQNVFVPLNSPGMTPGEPRAEVGRPEPIRLSGETTSPNRSGELQRPINKSGEMSKPETRSGELQRSETNRSGELSKPENKSGELPKPENRGGESKTEPNTSRRKGTVSSLQTPVMRSHSMSSIAEKYRGQANINNINTNNIYNNYNSNNNSANNSGNINVYSNNSSNNNSAHSSMTYPGPNYNGGHININGSGSIPNPNYRGDEWRNNSSPSVSRHSSLQYGKSFHTQGHRSLSDSQINPFWLPQNPATREQIRVQFFRSMDISQGDSDIVMYLAEVVKEQQSNEIQGTETPVIRLDYSSCQVFHSKEKKDTPHPRRT